MAQAGGSDSSALLSFLESDQESHALAGVSSEGRRLVAALGRWVEQGMDARLETFTRTHEHQMDDWLQRSMEAQRTLARETSRDNQLVVSELSALVRSQMQLVSQMQASQSALLPPWVMAPPGWGPAPPLAGPPFPPVPPPTGGGAGMMRPPPGPQLPTRGAPAGGTATAAIG